jgi:hypothetical protein
MAIWRQKTHSHLLDIDTIQGEGNSQSASETRRNIGDRGYVDPENVYDLRSQEMCFPAFL